MAKKISQLTQATEVKSDDVTVIVQDGETKKLPLNMMVTKQDIENKKVAGLAKLDEIEATYENDTYTPTITVKNKSSVKTGEGDEVDYSANVMDGHVKSAILKGNTSYRDIDTGEILEAFEEGRNLELVSVKMPVLTTTGKNLFDESKHTSLLESSMVDGKEVFKFETGYAITSKNTIISNKTFEFKENTQYTIRLIHKAHDTRSFMAIRIFYSDGSFSLGGVRRDTEWSEYFITSTKDKTIVTITNDSGGIPGYIDYVLKGEIGLFEGVVEKYEPYKTNILTVNEDVTLRSNGNICDELNLLTGQLTQRIDEDGEVLSQEVVKTVDLMPSGTHPSTTPYCWKNGHIQLSSSGLLPNLEYSVVTSRAGQINQNATMIVKNDKRIFDLEILLAGGLVNTTYQALTLQNQVETGLSKVSLSSETEPDYLLYHMIMKLIEEKAYKLDDLTEKVSVFYLYEKLSDEQFETIYSALYPFVEDEIVEEPVVEELPEVVEDEVIM